MSNLDGVAAARAVEARRELGLSESEPVRDIAGLMRSLDDTSIIWRPLSTSISGCFIRGKRARVIVVNSARPLGHQHFTLAHEYYHLRFEPELRGVVCFDHPGTRSSSERLADLFAAHFLMPETAIKQWVFARTARRPRALNLADLVDIEHLFGVSHQAMLIRLQRLGLMSKYDADQVKQGITRAARSNGYDASLYRPSNDSRVQSAYARLAREALEAGLISGGKYEELLLEAGLGEIVFGGDAGNEAENEEV